MRDIEIGEPSAKTYLGVWPSVKTYYIYDFIGFLADFFWENSVT